MVCIIIPGTRVKRTFFNMDSQNNHSQCDHQPSVCRNFQRVYNCQKFKALVLRACIEAKKISNTKKIPLDRCAWPT